jgi:SAM-dependent methyltransferase
VAQYLFEHSWKSERQRLADLEAVFDPNTIRHLRAVGVPPGGRCLEVGAGAGSIARWLCQEVGPEGQVVATDIEVDFLEHLTEANLEVRCHNIAGDELEEAAFDLIHTRLVLEHVPERELCLKRLVSALAPGGALVVEEFDWASLAPADETTAPLFNEVMVAVRDAMCSAGYDHHCGRSMPGLLRQEGLVDLGAEGWVPVVRGPGSPAGNWWLMSLAKLRPVVLARTSLAEETLDRYLEMISRPDFTFLFLTLLSAWGRRPQV